MLWGIAGRDTKIVVMSKDACMRTGRVCCLVHS